MTPYAVVTIVALVGVVFLVYYALKKHQAVRAFFGCRLFNFSIETGGNPDDRQK